MGKREVSYQDTRVCLDPDSLGLEITSRGEIWRSADSYRPYFCVGQEKIRFDSAAKKEHFEWKTGVGTGIRSVFTGFVIGGRQDGMSFQTVIWIEYATQDVFFELTPLREAEENIGNFYWPGEMAFTSRRRDWYSVINLLQGLLIPNDWEYAVDRVTFDGQMCSAGSYMPWFGQVRPGASYIAIVCDPWDAGYQAEHPAGSDYCHLSVRWLPSLGKLAYRRCVKYRFIKDGDYNDLCKVYRACAKEKGLLVTLKEKAARNPLVERFIGSAIVHTCIKTHVSPDSAYYDREHPEKNDSVVPFAVREEQIRRLKEIGLEKVYLHLDGWGEPGYDNQHPDYLPACAEAGGWEGMRHLAESMKEMNYLFALHDQYRDYYFDAKTYDGEFSIVSPEGKKPDFCRWAGGWQTYICATQAPLYLKRNFTELFRQGIKPEGTYLDVFTCNESDECAHPWHRMTRKECIEYRKNCFDFLNAHDILPSSEEVADWAIPSVVTAHYGPYEFMLAPKKDPMGIPVPLFNLVYHDCVVLPWLMDADQPQGDYMLYALLNGGAAYLDCELEEEALLRGVERYRIVAELQEKVALSEMVRHEFLDGDYRRQKSVFGDGTEVEIDLERSVYTIRHAGQK